MIFKNNEVLWWKYLILTTPLIWLNHPCSVIAGSVYITTSPYHMMRFFLLAMDAGVSRKLFTVGRSHVKLAIIMRGWNWKLTTEKHLSLFHNKILYAWLNPTPGFYYKNLHFSWVPWLALCGGYMVKPWVVDVPLTHSLECWDCGSASPGSHSKLNFSSTDALGCHKIFIKLVIGPFCIHTLFPLLNEFELFGFTSDALLPFCTIFSPGFFSQSPPVFRLSILHALVHVIVCYVYFTPLNTTVVRDWKENSVHFWVSVNIQCSDFLAAELLPWWLPPTLQISP